MFTVGQVARAAGVSAKAVRLYGARGLLARVAGPWWRYRCCRHFGQQFHLIVGRVLGGALPVTERGSDWGVIGASPVK